MTCLTELIERVKAATGPDRELSRDVLTTVGGWAYEKRNRDAKLWMYGPQGHRKDTPGASLFGAPHVTSSIDAALALVERVCPDLVIHMTRLGDGSGQLQITEAWLAGIGNQVVDNFSPLNPKPEALAILLTALLALQSQGAP